MKQIILLLLCILSVGIVWGKGQNQEMSPEALADATVKHLTGRLELTEEQQKQMKTIYVDVLTQLVKLDSSSNENVQEKAKQLENELIASVKKMLNATQQKKFDEFIAEQKARIHHAKL